MRSPIMVSPNVISRNLSLGLLVAIGLMALYSERSAVDASKLRLCGKKLIDVLKKVCNHKYHRPSQQRLTYNSYTYRSSNRGISTHCCQNRCSYRLLKSYCADDPTTTTPSTTTEQTRVVRSQTHHKQRHHHKRQYRHKHHSTTTIPAGSTTTVSQITEPKHGTLEPVTALEVSSRRHRNGRRPRFPSLNTLVYHAIDAYINGNPE